MSRERIEPPLLKKPTRSSFYVVVIQYKDGTSNKIENVREYRADGQWMFYVAGSDFEQWYPLEPGDVVSVKEDEDYA